MVVCGRLAVEMMEVIGGIWEVKRRRRGRMEGRILAARTKREIRKMVKANGFLRTGMVSCSNACSFSVIWWGTVMTALNFGSRHRTTEDDT